MAVGGSGRGEWRRLLGPYFAAVVFMGPSAALAIVALRQIHLVAQSPIWLIPLILVLGQLITTSCGLAWDRSPTRCRLHAKIASQAIVVTATIYATGWGPALAVGLVLIGQETLASAGTSAQRAVVGWTLSCLAAGQGLIALGWAPSLIPVPEVHGLAVLMGVGIAFSYRSLRSALIEKEAAATLTESRERRFRALVQSSSDLVFVVDAAGAVTYASPSSLTVLGYEPDRLLGAESALLVHEDEIDELRATMRRSVEVPGELAEFSMRVRHGDGSWRWLEGLTTNLLDDPAVLGMVINARDVTDRRRRRDRQDAVAGLGRIALQAASLDALVAAVDATIVEMLDVRACRIVGVVEHPVDTTPAQPGILHGVDAEHDTQLGEAPGRTLRVPVGDPRLPAAHIEVVTDDPISADGRQFLESVASVLFSSIVRSRAEDTIRHQAMHDPLTGLPNRTLFNDRLGHALGRRARVGGYVAVMVVDLDGFKTINDSLGHLAGDGLLIELASRFGTTLRDFDTIARLGGDEFAILVDDLDAPDQAGRVAQRVLDALEQPLRLAGRDVAIGASIGIALADRPDSDAESLLSNADAAMYRAKREGKGCYRVFETSMHSAAVERMDLEQALRAALANHALTVHYQPVVDTHTGHVVSFEALARWDHPTRGFIPPDTFIPLAEESGLIIELGRAVLAEACRQTKIWHTTYPHLSPGIAVNVSRLQLVHPHFVDDVTRALAAADVDACALTLEITESVLVGDYGRVLAALDELRRTGVQIAIDDFGTGYSSFSALAELPIDTLKIDKSFIDKLTADHDGRGFVNAILQLAQSLHLHTTAEGVEHSDQRDELRTLGCTHIQGYLFAQPMPAVEVLEYLERHQPAARISAGKARSGTG